MYQEKKRKPEAITKESADGEVSRRQVMTTLAALGAGSVLGSSSEALAATRTAPGSSLKCVNTMADLRSYTFSDSAAPSVVLVLGYWSPGDGGGGHFCWDRTNAAADADNGGTVIRPTTAPTTSTGSNSSGRWRRFVSDTVSVLWFGAMATPDGASAVEPPKDAASGMAAGNTARFQAAIRSRQTSTFASRAPRVVVPAGTYSMSSPLTIDCGVILEGATGAWQPSTILQFKGTDGIHIHRESGDPHMADLSVIRDLALYGSGTTGHGVVMNAACALERLIVEGFPQDGVHIEASVPNNSASFWTITRVRVAVCGGHGLYVAGTDANVGCCTLFDASDNGGWGIYDASTVGNTYVGCHASSNALGAYKADYASAVHLFLNCYVEGSSTSSATALCDIVSANTLVLGGYLARQNTGASPTLATGVAGAQFNNSVSAHNFRDNDKGITALGVLGSADTDRTAFEFRTSDASVGPYRLQYGRDPAMPGWWQFCYANLTGAPLALSTGAAAEGDSQIWFEVGFYIGINAGYRVKVNTAASRPTVAGKLGDVMMNSNPTPGGYAGWICTRAGGAGAAEWKGYGLIEA